MPKKIILDTNFLFIPARYKVDVFSEIRDICDFDYTIYIVDKSLNEINNIIAKSRGKAKQEAELTLKIINKKNPKVLKTGVDSKGKSVDDIILGIASVANKNFIVATQDKELKQSLLKKGVSVIVLKQKKHLKLLRA